MSNFDGDILAYTVREFCEAAKISRQQLYRDWSRGRGPRRKYYGKKVLIPADEARRWIEALPDERERVAA